MNNTEKMKVRDIVNVIIQEANDRFSPIFSVDDNGFDGLMVCCDIIDSMIEKYGIKAYEFEVNEDNMDVMFTLEFGEIIVQSQGEESDSDVFRIIKAAKKFVVSSVDDETISIRLVYPGIWNKVL